VTRKRTRPMVATDHRITEYFWLRDGSPLEEVRDIFWLGNTRAKEAHLSPAKQGSGHSFDFVSQSGQSRN